MVCDWTLDSIHYGIPHCAEFIKNSCPNSYFWQNNIKIKITEELKKVYEQKILKHIAVELLD